MKIKELREDLTKYLVRNNLEKKFKTKVLSF